MNIRVQVTAANLGGMFSEETFTWSQMVFNKVTGSLTQTPNRPITWPQPVDVVSPIC